MNKGKAFKEWIGQRFPAQTLWDSHAAKYLVPKNLNFWYFFGVLSAVVLINQILTGIWLTMYYEPTQAGAFASVEHVMRDVRFGWLLRYMHSTGASMFFVVLYLHIYRGIMYGSHKAPRELVWVIGMCLFALSLIEAGSGYVLPWGQMSYWGAKVMVQIFTVIPVIGKSVAQWVMGDFTISGVALHRFFALHVIAIPLVVLFFVFLHVMALHHVGSNNPDGIKAKKIDKIVFHPYYTVKDFAGIVVFLIVFFSIIFFAPTFGGYFLEPANFVQANPMVTPHHIAPPWYMAPFYAILRAVPSKLLGVVFVALAVALLFVMPWLDRSKVRSLRYRGMWSKVALSIFVFSFSMLGLLGTMPLSEANIYFSRFFALLYFFYFFLMPIYTEHENNKKEPERVSY